MRRHWEPRAVKTLNCPERGDGVDGVDGSFHSSRHASNFLPIERPTSISSRWQAAGRSKWQTANNSNCQKTVPAFFPVFPGRPQKYTGINIGWCALQCCAPLSFPGRCCLIGLGGVGPEADRRGAANHPSQWNAPASAAPSLGQWQLARDVRGCGSQKPSLRPWGVGGGKGRHAAELSLAQSRAEWVRQRSWEGVPLVGHGGVYPTNLSGRFDGRKEGDEEPPPKGKSQKLGRKDTTGSVIQVPLVLGRESSISSRQDGEGQQMPCKAGASPNLPSSNLVVRSSPRAG
jgi:hypothetical protein